MLQFTPKLGGVLEYTARIERVGPDGAPVIYSEAAGLAFRSLDLGKIVELKLVCLWIAGWSLA